MEAARPNQQTGTTKRDLVVATWQSLGCPSVGARELNGIQKVIASRPGAGAVDSPAAIARLLADAGAELRHPEIIECDARWRVAQIEKNAPDFGVFDRFDPVKPLRLKPAEAVLRKLENLRKKIEGTGDAQALKSLRDEAVNVRQVVESLAKSEKLNERVRQEQIEIVEWLSIWIRTPTLFAEWIDLRKRSPDFQQRFLPKDLAP